MSEVMNSTHARMAIVPASPGANIAHVAVPPGAGSGSAVLGANVSDNIVRSAVRFHEDPAVPPNVLAVGDDLCASMGITAPERTPWRLDAIEVAPLRHLVLELSTERPAHEVATEIGRAGLLGRLVWIDADQDTWLDVDAVPYRVRESDPDPGDNGRLVEISDATRIELFAPGVRAGVDMVILADCSGSMSINDLPAGGESAYWTGGNRYLERAEALRQALTDLLQVRLRTDGRISRIALVEFTQSTATRFPRDGTMVELDGSAPPQLIQEFTSAVTLLRPQNASTDIGNALLEAANLLYRHGRPGNDKLIVLVSDGAHWKARGDEGTGEVVLAVNEPVSLMAHLHRDSQIRLHAIGISNNQLFQQWRQRGGRLSGPAYEPNHSLLEELVKVGGGDPTTVGGLEVLVEYFSGLGAGIMHRVERVARARGAGPLGEDAVRRLQEFSTDHGRGGKWHEAQEQLRRLAGECNNAAQRQLGAAVLGQQKLRQQLARLKDEPLPRTDAELQRVLNVLFAALQINPDLLRHDFVAAYRDELQRNRNVMDASDGPADALISTADRLTAGLSRLLQQVNAFTATDAAVDTALPTADDDGESLRFRYIE